MSFPFFLGKLSIIISSENFIRFFRAKTWLLSFLLVFPLVSNAQSNITWQDSCSGLTVGRVITPSLTQDSVILVCVGDTVTIQDTSVDKLHSETINVRYKLDNGSYLSNNKFEFVPQFPGVYELIFEISSDSGCAISTKYKILPQQITSQIDVTEFTQCLDGNLFDFKLLHTRCCKEALNIIDAKWSIGNSLDTTGTSFNYQFQKADTFEVTVAVTTDFGCKSFDTASIFVLPSARTYIIHSVDSVYCYQKGINDTFTLQRKISDWKNSQPSIAKNYWNRLTDTMNNDTLVWSFVPGANAFGRQIWYHTVETDLGCVHKDSVDFYIAEPPNAFYEFADSVVCSGVALEIQNSSNIDTKDPWLPTTFVRNNTDTSYSSSNAHKVLLSGVGYHVFDAFIETLHGCKDTVSNLVARVSKNPEALISYSKTEVCDGDTNKLRFISLSSIQGGVNRKWTFNSSTISSDSIFTLNPLDISPVNYGLKQLVFKVTNSDNCADSVSLNVGVLPNPAVIIQRLSNDSCLRDLQKFVVRSIYPEQKIKTATWTFADSTQVKDTTVSKAFVTTGTQLIKVLATDIFGCKDSTTRNINLSEPPKSKFGASSFFACEDKQKFRFFDSSVTSVGSIISRTWIFSDGKVIKNPTSSEISHTFDNAGTFQLSLGVVNSLGCVDTFSEKILVAPKPTADFTINNNSQCLNINRFDFSNNSISNGSQNTLNYYWNFGDSTISSATNPTKIYSAKGNFNIKLVATSPRGCSDSAVQSVTVLGLPTAKIWINDIDQCLDKQNFQFKDSSTNNSGSGSIIQREWVFSDNTTRTGAQITKSFVNNGDYDLTFYVRLSTGCYDSTIKKLSVYPKPKASFTVNKDTQCFTGNQFVFDNKSSIIPGGGSLSYFWSFGDTLSAVTTHPAISYPSYGNFKARLKATSQFGCIDTFELPVQVTANPSVSFSSVNALQQCNSNDSFIFKNQTNALNGRSLTYRWAISDGSTYTTKDIGHSFISAGSYQVVLVASNSLGCSDSLKRTVTVYQNPNADFRVNQLQQCFTQHEFTTNNQSSIGFNGGTLAYRWFFNYDSIANTNNIKLNNLKVGSYPLKLVVTSSNGCIDSMVKSLTVFASPMADFVINDSIQCLVNNSFNFDNTSTNMGTTPSYQWLFGDGFGAQTRNVKKTYTKFGTYNVTLVVKTKEGCADSAFSSVLVNSMPIVDFAIDDTAQCLAGNKFLFTAKTVNDDKSTFTHKWEFENGKTAPNDTSSYQFAKSGNYFVKLTAVSSFGCRDSLFKPVLVYAQPNALFSVNKIQQCLKGNEFKFRSLSNISTNTSLTNSWFFGDGAAYNGKDTSHAFTTADTFEVTLITKSINNCLDTFNSDVIVNPQPKADFTTTDTGFCLIGNNVKFTDATTISSGSVSNTWQFGDGKVSQGKNPINRYSAATRYLAKLTVRSNLGCEDSASKYITIYPNPETSYKVNLVEQCLNQNNFKFSDSTKIKSGTTTVFWDFGNGSTSNVKSSSASYNAIGLYSITQVSTSNFGCTDTFRSSIRVLPNPVSVFKINDSIQCSNANQFEFENNTTIAVGKFTTTWKYGDGTVQQRFNGGYTYANPGIYSVSQITESDKGCFDTLTKIVVVTEIPKVEFSLNQDVQCQKNNQFLATNNSIYTGKESVSYFWELGNGDTLLTANLDYSYPLNGGYNLVLNALTSEGCLSKLSKSVRVNPQGLAEFNLVEDSFCLFNNVVRFINKSRVDGDRFSAFNWDFGDGNKQSIIENSPIDFSYNSVGTFTVRLETVTLNLCRDTHELPVTIIPMPVANVSVDKTTGCFNDQGFYFQDISTNPTKNTKRTWIAENTQLGSTVDLNYSFKNVGTNAASLVIIDEFGCTDTFRTVIRVLPSPTANFLVNQIGQCLEVNQYEFVNVSEGTNGKGGLWQPEPGSAATDENLDYIYYNAGTYSVKLTVYNDDGCQDTFVKNITVHPSPEGFLTFDPSCIYTPVYFDGNSSIKTGVILNSDWVLGDGTYSSELSPVHSYQIHGRFPVSLKLTSDKGCKLLLVDSIDIYPKPEAVIGSSTEILNINQPQLQVYDESPDGPYLNYEWDMGDGTPIIADFEAIHTYEDTGWYRVSLMVESFDGCLDTGFRDFYVAPEHRFLFPTAFSPNNDGINDVYQPLGKFHSIRIAKVRIFNELGNLVFETEDLLESWNGKLFNTGVEMSSGTYLIRVDVTDSYKKQFEYTQRFNLVK